MTQNEDRNTENKESKQGDKSTHSNPSKEGGERSDDSQRRNRSGNDR